MKKDTSVIPKGYYCYDEKGPCPYWRCIEDRPDQENGYCDYIEEGDLEINADTEEYDPKTGKVSPPPFPVGLLWDMVKECSINHYSDEEWEQMIKDGKVTVRTFEKPIEPIGSLNRDDMPILRRKSKK